MRKLFLFAFILLFACSTVSLAQPRFGAKLGLNLSTAKISPMSDGVSKKAIAGLIVGASIGIPLKAVDDNVSLRGDLSYTVKGAKLTWDGGSVKYTYDELDLSPFIVYNIPGVSGAHPFVQIGPELGFVMSTNQNVEIDNGGSKSEDIKHSNGTDISLNIGGGVGLPLKNRADVVFDIRYCLGLSNMDDRNDVTAKLRGFQITIGYMFPPKR